MCCKVIVYNDICHNSIVNGGISGKIRDFWQSPGFLAKSRTFARIGV